MREEREKRLVRLLSLVPFILQNPGIRMEELAGVFELSLEQLLKDLKVLSTCGVPDDSPDNCIEVHYSSGDVSIVLADYFVRPLRFTQLELEALIGALRQLLESGIPRAPALANALGKLEAALGEVTDVMPTRPPEEDVRLSELRRAIKDSVEVDLWYYGYARDELAPRTLQPLLVFFYIGNWYLRAIDVPTGSERLFRIDRIKSIDVSDRVFEPPELDEQDLLDNPFLFNDPDIDARLRLDKELAVWAEEQPIFDEVTETADGVICIIRKGQLQWLTRELVRLGPRVHVLEPEELREAMRGRLSRMTAIYGG
ncbi:MAG: helix-turn-helix transcriptional regulator [Candidatus Geothermincolia bacterium]